MFHNVTQFEYSTYHKLCLFWFYVITLMLLLMMMLVHHLKKYIPDLLTESITFCSKSSNTFNVQTSGHDEEDSEPVCNLWWEGKTDCWWPLQCDQGPGKAVEILFQPTLSFLVFYPELQKRKYIIYSVIKVQVKPLKFSFNRNSHQRTFRITNNIDT